MRWKFFLFGGCVINAKRYDVERLLNICMHYGLVYRNLRIVENEISMECSLYNACLLDRLCKDRGIYIQRKDIFGLPKIMSICKKRMGIILGLLLICAMIVVSQMYVWDIRVSGDMITDEFTVINELKNQNFHLGTYLPNVDIDMIENAVLINSPSISWISINLKGTVAYVEIREKESFQQNIKDNSPANLIASMDGLIEYFEVSRGNIAVKQGQNVRKGDLLVSGVYDSNVWGYGYLRPQGAVFARTIREINIEIPLKYQEKIYLEDEIVKKTLFFFSKPIKLYRNTGFLGGTYDTINNKENIYFLDGTKLPFSIESIIYRPYVYEERVHTKEQAIELAYEELDDLIFEYVEDGAFLLRKNVIASFSEDSYKLDCKIILIENIAQISEFVVEK